MWSTGGIFMCLVVKRNEILRNYASVELLDWKNHVPVFAPDYVAVFDGELLEVLRFDVAVVLWVSILL